MNFTDFLSMVDEVLLRTLGDAGFKRNGSGNWNRRRGDDISVISFQKHSADPSFCVNLGVHYAFVPKAGSTETPTDGQIELPECAIKLRLTSDPTRKDQWWSLSSETSSEVAALIRNRGLAIFDSYQLAGPISKIEIKDIEAGVPGLLSSLTKVSACLLLARIHEQMGRHDNCIEAATLGIRHAGMASGPKKALKEILKRNGQSS